MSVFSEQILTLDQASLKVIVPLICSLIGFAVAWFFMVSEKRKSSLIEKYGEDKGLAVLIISSKWIGAISMGVFPMAVYLSFFPEVSLSDLGLGINSETAMGGVVSILFLMSFVVPLAIRRARNPKVQITYPQIRAKNWSYKTLRNYLISWAVYMTGYEIMYRSVLLFPLVEVLGMWPAIAINVVFSSTTHIQKGLTETIGSVPLSIVFSLISIYTGSIWFVTLLHVVMAVTNSYMAFKYHPEMELVEEI